MDTGSGHTPERATLQIVDVPEPNPAPTPAETLWRLGPKATLCHEEAARHLGIELVEDTGIRRVTVPRNRSRVRVSGWTVVRADLRAEEIVTLDGLPMTSAARTVRDLARVLPIPRAVAAADSALRLHLVQFNAVVVPLTDASGRGAARLRQVGALVDPLSGSVLESLLRVLLVTAGLPSPRTQYAIHNEFGRVIARVDFCWPSQHLIVEADGFAFHSDRAAYRRDRMRMNELERHGWRVLRVTWEDVLSRPTYVVALVRDCLRGLAVAA